MDAELRLKAPAPRPSPPAWNTQPPSASLLALGQEIRIQCPHPQHLLFWKHGHNNNCKRKWVPLLPPTLSWLSLCCLATVLPRNFGVILDSSLALIIFTKSTARSCPFYPLNGLQIISLFFTFPTFEMFGSSYSVLATLWETNALLEEYITFLTLLDSWPFNSGRLRLDTVLIHLVLSYCRYRENMNDRVNEWMNK